jgi:hypothetical protein
MVTYSLEIGRNVLCSMGQSNNDKEFCNEGVKDLKTWVAMREECA